MKEYKNLEDYLRDEIAEGKIDFSLRASLDNEGEVNFYIHPAGRDGGTADYYLRGGLIFVKTPNDEGVLAKGNPAPDNLGDE